MENRTLAIPACLGLAIGGLLGIAGTFAPSAALRGLAWGIDGLVLVMAAALLTILHVRKGNDLVGAGFLIFAIGEGLVVSGAAMDLGASAPGFAAGAGLWSVGLALISLPAVYPLPVRLLGLSAAVMLAATAVRIFAGAELLPTSSPLPFFAYPLLVATMFGWIWAQWRPTGRRTTAV